MKPSLLLRGPKAELFDQMINKALNLLTCQFDLEIKYIEKNEITSSELYLLRVVESNLITYPVNFSGIFKGYLELHFKNNLNLKQIHLLDSLLNLSIKSPAQYLQRLALLGELEKYLEAQKDITTSKVIDFNDFRKSKKIGKKDTNLIPKNITKSHPPIYIEGNNTEDKRKLALELHYFLGYNAFVSFQDIEKYILNYRDIANLKKSTIYIPDFNILSTEQKIIFLDYFTEPNSSDQPLIISSSETNYAFLLRDTLNRTLLKFLSIYHIRLNKPLDEIKKDGFTTFLNSILKDPKYFTTKH